MSENPCACQSLSGHAGSGICQRDQKEYQQLREKAIAAETDACGGFHTVTVMHTDGDWVVLSDLMSDFLPKLSGIVDAKPFGYWSLCFGRLLDILDANTDRLRWHVSLYEEKLVSDPDEPGYLFLRDSYAEELAVVRAAKVAVIHLFELAEVINAKQQSFKVDASGWDNDTGGCA